LYLRRQWIQYVEQVLASSTGSGRQYQRLKLLATGPPAAATAPSCAAHPR
jgi:hypothetical protein